MLLEVGVFLVSVKLIIMTHKNSVANKEIEAKLNERHAILKTRDK